MKSFFSYIDIFNGKYRCGVEIKQKQRFCLFKIFFLVQRKKCKKRGQKAYNSPQSNGLLKKNLTPVIF